MDDRPERPSGGPQSVGAYEAKTRFSELIARAARGESFVVTRNGRQMARIEPPNATNDLGSRAAGQRILARLEARNRGEFDFDAFWQELKRDRDGRADSWHSS